MKSSLFAESLPSTRHERWDLLDRLIANWFDPLPASDVVTELEIRSAEQILGISLPLALREWNLRFGCHEDIWSCQDFFHRPSSLKIFGGDLNLMVENKGCVNWFIRGEDLHLEDPPVYVGDIVKEVEADSISSFAIQSAVQGIKFGSNVPHLINGQVEDQSAIAKMMTLLPRLPFPELHWPVETKIFGTDELIVELDGDVWMWVSARNQRVLEEFKSLTLGGVDWQDTRDPANQQLCG